MALCAATNSEIAGRRGGQVALYGGAEARSRGVGRFPPEDQLVRLGEECAYRSLEAPLCGVEIGGAALVFAQVVIEVGRSGECEPCGQ